MFTLSIFFGFPVLWCRRFLEQPGAPQSSGLRRGSLTSRQSTPLHSIQYWLRGVNPASQLAPFSRWARSSRKSPSPNSSDPSQVLLLQEEAVSGTSNGSPPPHDSASLADIGTTNRQVRSSRAELNSFGMNHVPASGFHVPSPAHLFPVDLPHLGSVGADQHSPHGTAAGVEASLGWEKENSVGAP